MDEQIETTASEQPAQNGGGASLRLSTFGSELAQMNGIMQQAGEAADEQAARATFKEHVSRIAPNTERRLRAGLALFERYLQACQVPAAGLYDHPEAWRGISWGLVEGFKVWQLKQGYAIGSINDRLSTVRTFALLATRAEAITPDALRLIQTVKGYTHAEAENIDNRRRADGLQTRTGHKKAEAVIIPADIAEALKAQPGTPQGRRDALLMCLLLDHGLRVGEIAKLTAKNFDLSAGTMTFKRPKVKRTRKAEQTHELTPDTRRAAIAYISQEAPAEGILWRRSCKGTSKLSVQLSEISAERALTKRVELLARHAGLEGLSAHDCRHFAATYEARKRTPLDRFVDMFGWNSPAMALRYIEAAHIANEGTARVKGA